MTCLGWMHSCETKGRPVWLPLQSVCPFCWKTKR